MLLYLTLPGIQILYVYTIHVLYPYDEVLYTNGRLREAVRFQKSVSFVRISPYASIYLYSH